MTTFSAKLRQEDQLIVIDLEGSIDAQADQVFSQAFQEADGMNSESIALNFSKVDYINSTGIALIVELLAQARKSRKHLIVYGLSEHYLEVFQITRLSDFMDIYEDETNAKTGVLNP
jgi:anti-anti-sigma factor